MKKEGSKRKTTFEKQIKIKGLIRVCPDRPGHGSTHRVDQVLPGFTLAGLLPYPDRYSHRVPG